VGLVRRNLLALLAYVAVSVAYLGPHVLPHLGSRVVGDGPDTQIFVWSFAWWPHAIVHSENPVFTHAIFVPGGFNLAWATSVPGLALAFAPATWAFGPVASFNLAAILMPALDAFTAFLLCRHVTRSTWASLAGGYLFGFSSYVLAGSLDHIHTTAVFLVPLAALLVLRFLEGSLDGRAFAVRFGALLAAQLLISTEILFTLTLAVAGSLLLALLVAPTTRRRIRALAAPLLASYAGAALVTLPFGYYLATGTGFEPPGGSENYVADLLNYAVPTQVTWFGHWWTRTLAAKFPTNDVERGAYLGLPLLAIVVWFAAIRWRTAAGRFLVAAFLVAVVASVGRLLWVGGHQVGLLPWSWIASLPFLVHTTPARFSMYAALAASVMVAMWAASRLVPVALRIVLPLLAMVAVAPNLSLTAWSRTLHVPELDCLKRGETVLAFPFGSAGDSMVWQAEAGFRFRLAGGYIAIAPPPSYSTPAIQHVTTADDPSEITPAAVRTLVRQKGVDAIFVDPRERARYAHVLQGVGRVVQCRQA
jgi:hypothetical protein